MLEEKKKLFIIIVGVLLTVTLLFGVYFLLRSDGKAEGLETMTSTSTPTSAKTSVTPNQLIPTVVKDSILKSQDGGDTFEPYFTVATVEKLGLADVLSVSFHPVVEDRVIVTTFQDGLFINEDKINSWSPIPFPPKQIYSFILDKNSPDNRVFASGVVDENGRIFRTDNAGINWRAVYAEPGNGTYVSGIAQHPQKTDIILAGTSGGTIIKSLDGGTSWKNIGSKISGIITHFTFDSTNRLFAYFLSYKKSVYHSRDEGTTWLNWEEEKKKEVETLNKQSRELAKNGDREGAKSLSAQATALNKRNTQNKEPTGILVVVTDPSKTGTIYAGAAVGLYRSTDFGKYWTKLNIIESAEKFPIRSIAINPKNSNEIVFVAGKSFYKSTNTGETWSVTPLSNARNASFVAYDPFDPRTLFIGVSSQ